jgi:hypothetical protein
MKPITIACEDAMPLAPDDIAGRILNFTKWPEAAGGRVVLAFVSSTGVS